MKFAFKEVAKMVMSIGLQTMTACAGDTTPWIDDINVPSAPKPLLQPIQLDNDKTFQILIVCGTKGAGKTSTLAKLYEVLKAEGYYVEQQAIFVAANDEFKNNEGAFGMFTQSADTALIAEAYLRKMQQTYIDSFTERFKKAHESKGVLLLDRGWMTIICSLDEAKHLSTSQKLELWQNYWAQNLYPTLFIATSCQKTKERRQGQLDLKSGLPTAASVDLDYQRRLNLVKLFSSWIVAEFDTSQEISAELIASFAHLIKKKLGEVL